MGRWFESACVDRFECMFDGLLPEVLEFAALDDAALVDAAGGWARAENAACARKLAVMAEIFTRRTRLFCRRARAVVGRSEAAVAAEMAAAVNVSQGMALHQTHRGVALRDRLPGWRGCSPRGWSPTAGAHHRVAHPSDHRRGRDGRGGSGAGRPDQRVGGVVDRQNRGRHRRPGRRIRSRRRCDAAASRRPVPRCSSGHPPMWRAPRACGPACMPPTRR